MGIDLTKLTQGVNASLQGVSKKAGVQNIAGTAPKFNTGILDKDTVSFSEAAKRTATKTGFPFCDKTTQVAEHHDINSMNCEIRAVLKRLEKGETPKRGDDFIMEIIKEYDAQFAKLPPLEDNFIFYRGRSKHPVIQRWNEDFKIIEAAKPGDIIVPDTAYSYGAFKRELADNWASDMMMEIFVPKGAKISRNMEHGGEVVFPRGAQYKVILKEKDELSGKDMIALEYILPEK